MNWRLAIEFLFLVLILYALLAVGWHTLASVTSQQNITYAIDTAIMAG